MRTPSWLLRGTFIQVSPTTSDLSTSTALPPPCFFHRIPPEWTLSCPGFCIFPQSQCIKRTEKCLTLVKTTNIRQKTKRAVQRKFSSFHGLTIPACHQLRKRESLIQNTNQKCKNLKTLNSSFFLLKQSRGNEARNPFRVKNIKSHSATNSR